MLDAPGVLKRVSEKGHIKYVIKVERQFWAAEQSAHTLLSVSTSAVTMYHLLSAFCFRDFVTERLRAGTALGQTS